VADNLEGGLVGLLEELEADVFGCSEAALSSSGVAAVVFADKGRMRATTTAAARRGEMLMATSCGVVPCATSRTEPSGSSIRIICSFPLFAVI
jgi:hypothetical protein